MFKSLFSIVQKLKISTRISLIVIAFTCCTAATLLYVVSQVTSKDLAFTEQELRGVAFQRPLDKLIELLPTHQAMINAGASDSQVTPVTQAIDEAFTAVDDQNKTVGADLKFDDAYLAAKNRSGGSPAHLLQEWTAIKGMQHSKREDRDTAYGQLMTDVQTSFTHSSETSNLILDPELDSYNLADSVTTALPAAQQRLSDSQAAALQIIQAGKIDLPGRLALATFTGMVQQADMSRVTGDIGTTADCDKGLPEIAKKLQATVVPQSQKYNDASQKYTDLLNKLSSSDAVTVTPADLAGAGSNARATSFDVWDGCADQLDGLLTRRIEHLAGLRLKLLSGAGGVVLFLCVGSVLLTVSVNRQLRAVTGSLLTYVERLSTASSQAAQTSQSLAQGASEQAASLEETSSSLEEISSMTKKNADTANTASRLSADAKSVSDKGNSAMSRMGLAITEIQKSATETAKIVKTIDEIAFQTNLLALNAAVEAARAGEAGKGFAVVAEEVRNLAMRSAEAAKTTSALIEGSVQNARNGVEIAEEVARTLAEITGAGSKVGQLVSEIAAASHEQHQGVNQVNQAVQQMDRVTQSNAAAAEQSASSAEELTGQSEQLNRLTVELVSIVGGTRTGGDRRQTGRTTPVTTSSSRDASKPRSVRNQTQAPAFRRAA